VKLVEHRGKAFSMILGQCTQVLLDKMKYEKDWDLLNKSRDPLKLFSLIEKVVMEQMSSQYPYAAVYEQEKALYAFHQGNLSNQQWYEKFNTKVDVGTAMGITRHHKVLLEHTFEELRTTAEAGKEFNALAATRQQEIRDITEERYLAYVLLQQSGIENRKVRSDLRDDYTKKVDNYPKTRQDTLYFLDKYTKSGRAGTTPAGGSSFAQLEEMDDPFWDDKSFWEEKKCFNCRQKGHPQNQCPNPKFVDDDDNKSVNSKTSNKSGKSNKTSKSSRLSKVDQKKFTQMFQNIMNNANANDTGGLESDDGENEEEEVTGQVNVNLLNCGATFNQSDGDHGPLVLRDVVLLDSCSTMDLFCNPRFVQDIVKVQNPITVESNGGKLQVRHKAKVSGYNALVYYDGSAIANILSLKNLGKQYPITYDSAELMFVVHREAQGKPDMHFVMHYSRLHYWVPC
jgi:hypothetical protein